MGGISKVATELAYGLCREGHEVEVFCLGRSAELHLRAPFKLHAVRPKWQLYDEYPVVSFSLAAFRMLMERHREHPFDVSHGMNFNNYGLTFWRRKMRRAGLAHVSTAFETTQMEIQAKWTEFLDRPNLHLFAQIAMECYLAPWQKSYIGWGDAITTEDEETKAQLGHLGIDQTRVRLIPSGIDISRVHHCRSDRPGSYPEGKRVLLCPGRVDPRKGTQYLIRALERLEWPSDWHVVIVGGGRGQYIETMGALSSELGLDDKLSFCGQVDDLYPYYQHADAVVIPSLSEGIPLTLQEALAFGLPVFCSKLRGVYQWAKSLAAIRWFEAADVASMAICLSSLDKLPCEDQLVTAKKWMEDFSWECVVRRYVKVYEEARSGLHERTSTS